MGRPAGMKKINGLWYLPNGTLAPSSAAKINQGKDTPTPAVIVPQKPAKTVTAVSQDRPMVQGVSMYTPAEIKHIEESTGLVFVGNFANSDGDKYSGELVPVFLRADHSDEKRKEDLMRIRKGI